MLTAKEALRQSTLSLIEFIDGKIEQYAFHRGRTKLVLNLKILPEKAYKILLAKGYKVKYEMNMEGKNLTVISWGEEDEGSES
jgi:hypothetical protein